MRHIIYILLLLLFACSDKKQHTHVELPLCSVVTVPEVEAKGPPDKPKPGLIYLDFDGHNSTCCGNWAAANANESDMQIVQQLVRELYGIWDMTVTLSEAEYYAFQGPKQKIVLTTTQFGATGRAIMNTMITGDTFNVALAYWPATRNITCCYSNEPNMYAALVVAHEIAHTLGVPHSVRNCLEDYATGPGGFCPILGDVRDAVEWGWVTTSKTFTSKTSSSEGIICPYRLNQVAVISKTIDKL